MLANYRLLRRRPRGGEGGREDRFVARDVVFCKKKTF